MLDFNIFIMTAKTDLMRLILLAMMDAVMVFAFYIMMMLETMSK